MNNMFNKIEELFQLTSEKLARQVDRKDFLRVSFTGIFMGMLALIANPFQAKAAAPIICELTRNDTSCLPPNGQYCSNCPTSVVSACPRSMQVSYVWGYTQTGCWCIQGGAARCCDCTSFNQYTQHPSDCGCLYVF